MLVSIIIPVYRSKRYIEKCVRSVLDQTYKDLEIIIVDDCGRDGSIDIIKRVLIEFPSVAAKVRFVYHEFNQGCASARRDGMKEATGKYILQVDSDDYIAPTMVEQLVTKAEEHDADMVVCNYYYNYTNRRVQINVKIYPVPGINMGDDMTILLQALFHMGKISYIEDALYYYNDSNEDSLSKNGYPMVNDVNLIKIINNYLLDNNIVDVNINKSFELFRYGRLGRNLLYNDLDDVHRNMHIFNVSNAKVVFEHKRLPLHYKLIVYFYLNNLLTGVKCLRRLIRYKRKYNVQ